MKSGLPEGWSLRKLGEVCDILSGKNQKKVISPNGKYPIYGSSGIFGYANDYLCEAGTTIIGRKGTINSPIFVNTKFWNVDTAFGLFPNQLYDNKLLYYFCLGYNFHILDKSTTIPSLAKRDLLNIDIPCPPIKYQRALVSKIEELFSELDKGIENLQLAQQQLKTYRQAVLKCAFEGRLTEKWRKSQKEIETGAELVLQIIKEKERILVINNKKIKPKNEFDLKEDNLLFHIPKEWVWVRNENYLFEIKDGTHETPKYITSGIPFITQKNIKDGKLDFSNIQFISKDNHEKYYLRSNVTNGDIIISMIGHNRGMSAIVETERIFSIKNLGLFKFLHQLQSNKFSYYYIQSSVGLNLVLKKSKGGAQPFIGLTELRDWPVPVCSLKEQKQIVLEIEDRLSVVNKMEEYIMQSLQKSEFLRNSILKKAFEGNLIN